MQQFDSEGGKIDSEKAVLALKIYDLDKCSLILYGYSLNEYLKKQLPADIQGDEKDKPEVKIHSYNDSGVRQIPCSYRCSPINRRILKKKVDTNGKLTFFQMILIHRQKIILSFAILLETE